MDDDAHTNWANTNSSKDGCSYKLSQYKFLKRCISEVLYQLISTDTIHHSECSHELDYGVFKLGQSKYKLVATVTPGSIAS